MALQPAWKFIYASGAQAPIARRLYRRVDERYTGPGVRCPVTQWVVDDDGETFIAATNCGWARLRLEAWALGHPGTSYIESTAHWSAEERDGVLGEPPAPSDEGRER